MFLVLTCFAHCRRSTICSRRSTSSVSKALATRSRTSPKSMLSRCHVVLSTRHNSSPRVQASSLASLSSPSLVHCPCHCSISCVDVSCSIVSYEVHESVTIRSPSRRRTRRAAGSNIPVSVHCFMVLLILHSFRALHQGWHPPMLTSESPRRGVRANS